LAILANLFIRRFAREVGKDLLPIDDADARLLMQYSWPGNIRELEHVIERAVVLSRHSRLDLHKFIPLSDVGIVQEIADGLAGKILTMGEIQNMERQNITKALNQCSWKVSGPTAPPRLSASRPLPYTPRSRCSTSPGVSGTRHFGCGVTKFRNPRIFVTQEFPFSLRKRCFLDLAWRW